MSVYKQGERREDEEKRQKEKKKDIFDEMGEGIDKGLAKMSSFFMSKDKCVLRHALPTSHGSQAAPRARPPFSVSPPLLSARLAHHPQTPVCRLTGSGKRRARVMPSVRPQTQLQRPSAVRWRPTPPAIRPPPPPLSTRRQSSADRRRRAR